MLLMTVASDELASDDVSSGALLQPVTSDAVLQTHFFIHILSDAS